MFKRRDYELLTRYDETGKVSGAHMRSILSEFDDKTGEWIKDIGDEQVIAVDDIKGAVGSRGKLTAELGEALAKIKELERDTS